MLMSSHPEDHHTMLSSDNTWIPTVLSASPLQGFIRILSVIIFSFLNLLHMHILCLEKRDQNLQLARHWTFDFPPVPT